MKSVYLLVLVSWCQGLPLETRLAQLSAPKTVGVAVLDPLAIEVSWNKIDSSDDQNPVVGYKVKVWEVKNIETTKYTNNDGQVTQVEKVLEQPMDMICGPVEILSTPEKTSATYHTVKLDVTYEVRVQAFTKIQYGPLSDPIRIKLDKE